MSEISTEKTESNEISSSIELKVAIHSFYTNGGELEEVVDLIRIGASNSQGIFSSCVSSLTI